MPPSRRSIVRSFRKLPLRIAKQTEDEAAIKFGNSSDPEVRRRNVYDNFDARLSAGSVYKLWLSDLARR